MAGKTYSEAWAVSSKALDDCGVYNDLLNNLDIRGKWVVQLGIGIGIETERIAERAPGCLLGLDNDIAMIKHSAEYLNGKHLPVKVIIDEAGLRHYYNYDWKINPALINLLYFKILSL